MSEFPGPCTIEMHWDGRWHTVAKVELIGAPSQGYRGQTRLSYEPSHAIENLGRKDKSAVSCGIPVNLGVLRLNHWPAFLLDLSPAGAARRFWLTRLRLTDHAENEWNLLRGGACNAPGALRIQEATSELRLSEHPGFARDDILFMKEDFIDHCEKHGASVGGSSGAQGDARKFLLTEDQHGRWHPAESIPVSSRKREWLVKFPRHKFEQDEWVLRSEAIFHTWAKMLGFSKYGETTFEDRCLFVERFDVIYQNGIEVRSGLESLASVMGFVNFGGNPGHYKILESIATHSSNPAADIREYILRDLINLALGNKDNHLRNTAFIKPASGGIHLSPWYDLCPMAFDSEGVSRAIRWDEDESQGKVDWRAVFEKLERAGFVTAQQIRTEAAEKLATLASLLEGNELPSEVGEYCRKKTAELRGELQ